MKIFRRFEREKFFHALMYKKKYVFLFFRYAVAPLEVVILNNEINNQEHLSAGRTYKIECQALGSVPPAVITWWRNDQPFDHTSFEVRIEADMDGGGGGDDEIIILILR